MDIEKTKNSIGGIPPVIAFIAGVLLLLPLLWVLLTTRLQPLQTTFNLSTQEYNAIRPAEFVGNANFEALAQDRRYSEAINYTVSFVLARTIIILFVPPLIGLLAGMGNFALRTINRLLLSVVAVLIAPVSLIVLWRLYVSPLWGTEPSPIFSPDFAFALVTPSGAQNSLLALDGIITLAIALAVGVTAFMAIVRGRSNANTGRAGIGLWLVCGLLALLSAAETFVLPYLLTGGGPGNSTLTLGINIFREGFQRFSLGYAAAQIVPLVIFMLPVVFVLWLVLVGLRLRLTYTPAPSTNAGGCMSILGLLFILMLALPIFGLVVWGVLLVNNNGGLASLPESINWNTALANTLIPLQSIWLIQLPVMWLAGIVLGFFRPLGRIFSNLLFLPLLFLALLPTDVLMLAWFINAREASILNTSQALNLPWLASGFALIVFRMFFDGAYDKYQAAVQSGKTGMAAFISQVVLPSLPILLVVGAALSFASVQSLTWNLIATNSNDVFNLPLTLAMMMNQLNPETGMLAAAAAQFIGIFALIFIPVFALLHIFVLDRLALVAGSGAKNKNDALFGDIDSQPQKVEWT